MNKTALIACEYSGIVRDSFENMGVDAWSCDIIPTESEQTKASKKHIQIDIRYLINYDELQYIRKYGKTRDGKYTVENYKKLPEWWDFLVGFPACTYLSFAYTGKERYSNERLQNKIEAYQFFLDLWSAQIEHICLENPMGYINSGLLPYSQIIEPFYFGHNYRKRTCLWLKNLPLLKHSGDGNLFEQRTHYEGEIKYLINGSSQRKRNKKTINKHFDSKAHSKFHPLVAKAMAEQWIEYINEKSINN